jgi:hypothetical protein
MGERRGEPRLARPEPLLVLRPEVRGVGVEGHEPAHCCTRVTPAARNPPRPRSPVPPAAGEPPP